MAKLQEEHDPRLLRHVLLPRQHRASGTICLYWNLCRAVWSRPQLGGRAHQLPQLGLRFRLSPARTHVPEVRSPPDHARLAGSVCRWPDRCFSMHYLRITHGMAS